MQIPTVKRRRIQKRDRQPSNGKQAVEGFSAVHGKDVRPKVKYAVIYRHRDEYSVSEMRKFFEVSRSG